MMRRVKLVTINMVIIRGASSFLSSITVIILIIMKRMTLSNLPQKGLIVIFDYEKDNNDEDGPAQPP